MHDLSQLIKDLNCPIGYDPHDCCYCNYDIYCHAYALQQCSLDFSSPTRTSVEVSTESILQSPSTEDRADSE